MPATYEEALAVIESRVNTWATTYSGGAVPIAFDNRPFVEPSPKSHWVRVVVREAAGIRTDLDATAPRIRNPGVVIVQVFTPKNIGSRKARELASSVADYLEVRTVSGILFRAAEVRAIGEVEKEYWQVNVTVPFHWNRIASRS